MKRTFVSALGDTYLLRAGQLLIASQSLQSVPKRLRVERRDGNWIVTLYAFFNRHLESNGGIIADFRYSRVKSEQLFGCDEYLFLIEQAHWQARLAQDCQGLKAYILEPANERAGNSEPVRHSPNSFRGSLLQSGHIDDKTIFYITLEQPIVGLVDLLNGDQFDVRGNSILGAEVQHLLRFPDTADGGAGQAAALHNQIEASDWGRLLRGAHQRHGAVKLQQPEIRIQVVFGRDRVEDKVETFRMFFHLGVIFRNHYLISSEAQSVGGFAWGRGEKHDVSAEGMGKFHPHVPKPAKADDADFLSFADLPMAQRRIRGDARAKKRCCAGGIQSIAHPQDIVFVYNDAVRVAAVGDSAEDLVLTVVRQGHELLTILLFPSETIGTDAAGVHQTSDRGDVALLEFLHGAAGFDHAADDLVARYNGIRCRHDALPLVAHLVQVCMADAAVENFDLHVLVARR